MPDLNAFSEYQNSDFDFDRGWAANYWKLRTNFEERNTFVPPVAAFKITSYDKPPRQRLLQDTCGLMWLVQISWASLASWGLSWRMVTVVTKCCKRWIRNRTKKFCSTSFSGPLSAVIECDQEDNQNRQTTQDRAKHDVKGIICDYRIRADHIQRAYAVANVGVTMSSIVLSIRRRIRWCKDRRTLGLGSQNSAEFRCTLFDDWKKRRQIFNLNESRIPQLREKLSEKWNFKWKKNYGYLHVEWLHFQIVMRLGQ